MPKTARLVCRGRGGLLQCSWLVSESPARPAPRREAGRCKKRATPARLEPRRQDMLRFFAGCMAALLLSGQAVAQDFPTKPITIIVGVAPGGTLDTLARLIGNSLSKTLKQPVVVEKPTGASGLIEVGR